MEKKAKIFIAGSSGLVGSAIVSRLLKDGYTNLAVPAHARLDLTKQNAVNNFFKTQRPRYVVLASGRVGGIAANIAYPAQFIFENLAMQNNVIHASYTYGVKKLLFFASACAYPRKCLVPIKEEYLLTGPLEPTNHAYAVAKIAGIEMCKSYNRQYGKDFIACVATNVYGERDDFSLKDSHVIPALIRKFFAAKFAHKPEVSVWGSGRPVREFIYAEDVADAAVFLMKKYSSPDIINVCTGKGVTIKELCAIIKEVSGYSGRVIFDTSKPDGMPVKVLSCAKINGLGWKAKFALREGIKRACAWYLKHYRPARVSSR